MPVRYNDPNVNPSEDFVGRPVRFPHIMLCTAAEPGHRSCGRTWVANSEPDFLIKAAERRDHEAACKGGLIAASSMAEAREAAGEHRRRRP